jgi:hypothetical protein
MLHKQYSRISCDDCKNDIEFEQHYVQVISMIKGVRTNFKTRNLRHLCQDCATKRRLGDLK